MTELTQPLWTINATQQTATGLARFMQLIADENRIAIDDQAALHQWSLANPAAFWDAVWRFTGIKASVHPQQILQLGERFFDAKWFIGARLNFAENLLSRRDAHPAIVSHLENGERCEISYAELYEQVAKFAASLRQVGIGPGDRVAGLLPNIPQAVIAMLAATSLGAVWSSCSPDFGDSGVLDRFGQIEPKVLVTCDGYYYGGKTFSLREKLAQILPSLPSLQRVVIVPVLGEDEIKLPGGIAVDYQNFIDHSANTIEFAQLPFDHPLYILYSSGTTGKPKCIVHSAGGTLLQHLKEHRLHTDLNKSDVFFYFTTCGWMMWNWLASGLASGCTIVLFDGSPFHPSPRVLIDLIDSENITVFGTSARYLASLEKADVKPRQTHRLTSLRTLLSTGSPLSAESFRFVYRDIKTDICLSSISGGTDIVSCFIAGSPLLPVWLGEMQCAGLGMAVDVVDENGKSISSGKGELVCRAPFPSCPLGFWNDPGHNRFIDAYFSRFPGLWAQGDFAEKTAHGGYLIHGRSDATLNPGGVRIGTAEIYRQVEKLPEVLESVCIGQRWRNDVRIVLFVIMREGVTLDDGLRERIRRVIRDNTTPRHVPAKIIAVPDIPRTRSGKIVELAVNKVVHGETVSNTEALANAEALVYFRDVAELSEE